MTGPRPIEERIVDWLAAEAPGDVPLRALEATFSITRTLNQDRPQPRWAPAPPFGRRPRPVVAVVVALLIVLALVAAAVVGGLLLRPTTPGPRTPGLLALSRNGTVFLAAPNAPPIAVAAEAGYWFDVAAWSPDGRYLAIHKGVDGRNPSADPSQAGVLILDSRTFVIRRVVGGTFLGWAPDGPTLIAIDGATLELVRLPAGDVRELNGVLSDVSPSGALMGAGHALGPTGVSPDGRWMAVMSDRLLLRIDLATGDVATLYDNGAEMVGGLSWSPDSTHIAYARSLSPTCHTCTGPIVVVNVDGGQSTIVSEPGLRAIWPQWSPRGDWIAYLGDGLEIVRPDVSERRTLPTGGASDLAGPIAGLSWNSDGSSVAYLVGDMDGTQTIHKLGEVPIDGGAARRIDDGRGVEWFAWQTLPGGEAVPSLPSR